MRYEKTDGITHIYVEEGETEQIVLRAIVKASFELARPAGMGWIQFKDSKQMTDNEADSFITLTPRYAADKSVVNMDYVQGRQCKTYISRNDQGHFTLANRSYERDRGAPDPMFNRAKEIVATVLGNVFMQVDNFIATEFPSTTHTYKGENLTLRLKEYGFARQYGEGDWDFRKRTFPDMFTKDPDRAMEFLMGCCAAEWNDMERALYMTFIHMNKGKPDHNALMKFANGFASDPLEKNEKQKRLSFFAGK